MQADGADGADGTGGCLGCTATTASTMTATSVRSAAKLLRVCSTRAFQAHPLTSTKYPGLQGSQAVWASRLHLSGSPNCFPGRAKLIGR